MGLQAQIIQCFDNLSNNINTRMYAILKPSLSKSVTDQFHRAIKTRCATVSRPELNRTK
jgi:hypothetical protein